MITETIPQLTNHSLLDSIISWINSWGLLTALATIITVLGGIAVIIRLIAKNYRFLLCRSIKVYKHEGYYSEAFVCNNLKRAKKIVQIICVRNARISSPDILRSFRDFVTNKNGCIDLFYMDPDEAVSDDIIDKIRITLPTPPISAQACRDEIIANESRIKEAVLSWDRAKQSNISIYRYQGLPVLHMCRFDNRIFLGFQFFDPSEAAGLNDNTLNDYCTVINAKSALGKLILKQVDYLQENQATKQEIVEPTKAKSATTKATEPPVTYV